MKKIMEIVNYIVGTLIMFLIIGFIAIGLDSHILMVVGLVISPIIMIYITKTLKVKAKRYYGIITPILIVSIILGASLAKPDINNSSAENNQGYIEDKLESKGEEDTCKLETVQEPKSPEIQSHHEEISNEDTFSSAEVHFIDTGNSDAILIKNQDKSLLIDGGDNDDEGLVSNYIKEQGIKELTYVIATHPDADHMGGLDAVINSVDVKNLFVSNKSADTKTYTDFINAAANKGLNSSVPLDGAEFKLTESSYIKFYNTDGGSDSNESSLVTLFVNGSDKFLFMGDAGSETEGEILSQLTDVDVVKIGHHGSKSSTSQRFLDKIKPEYGVIQVGSNNTYKHPSSITMAKLKENGIEVHRNNECGNIIFQSRGNSVSTKCKKGSFTPGDHDSSKDSLTPKEPYDVQGESNYVEPSPSTTTVVDQGEKFVITQTGTKYHLPNCSTIKQVKGEVTREEAEAQGYSPCGRCNP